MPAFLMEDRRGDVFPEVTVMEIIDTDLLDRTSAEARTSPRLRMNRNFPARPEAPLNRLLNAMETGTFLPVHRHTRPAKDEAIVVLRGRVAVFVFDDGGRIVRRAIVDPKQGVYGFDIPSGEWHGLLVLESGTVVFETKAGPYVPIAAEDMAPWTPAADDREGIERFMAWLHRETSRSDADCETK